VSDASRTPDRAPWSRDDAPSTGESRKRADGGSPLSTGGGGRALGGGPSLSARFGRPLVAGVLLLVVSVLVLPVVVTFVSSFARAWTGVLPSGFVTTAHWEQVLGLSQVQDAADYSLRLDAFLTTFLRDPIGAFGRSPLFRSLWLALGGVLVNLVAGVPVAYAVARYDFPGKEWLNAFAVLPLAPGVVLGVAFLRAYPDLAATDFGLIVGYSLLKAPYMVMAVQSSFESMPLRQLEESARSLGASWLRTFLTVLVPNARTGIVSGSIICWSLAAAEFNFSYIVFSKGTRPLALFLKANISNSSFLTTAAAVSVFFLLVAAVTAALQLLGGGFGPRSNP
jgi:putative spermidine/putrescine transport system permease protein